MVSIFVIGYYHVAEPFEDPIQSIPGSMHYFADGESGTNTRATPTAGSPFHVRERYDL